MSKIDHTKNIVEVDGVSFSYGSNAVLSNVSLKVHQGDYIGVVGPNGSGKTTLLKIMVGLLSPLSGKVRLFGTDIEAFKDRSKIGYVPQKVTNFDQNFPATVFEVVLMGRYGKRGLVNSLTKEDRVQAENALKHVGMWDYRDRLIGDLSGGQQQRIFIARALAGEPDVIFLDEPTSGIDTNTQNDFYKLLKKLNQELDLTLILVTHDIERIAEEAMHIAYIDGSLYYYSSPTEFISSMKSKTEVSNITAGNIKKHG